MHMKKCRQMLAGAMAALTLIDLILENGGSTLEKLQQLHMA